MRVSRLMGLALLVLPASATGGPIPVPERIMEELAKMAQAVTLTGVVVDAADRPVAGVQILAESSFDFRSRRGPPTVRSGSDGGFRFEGLRPGGVYELIAVHEGFSQTRTTVQIPTAGRPAAAPLRILLQKGTSVFGRVVDEAGLPVPGAEVNLRAEEGASLKATSGQDGRFEIRHIGPGTCNLAAQAKGYSYAVRPNIEIPAGEAAFDLGTVTLPASAVIAGRVTDARGAAIEGAEISVLPSDMEDFDAEQAMDPDLVWGVPTEADGSFRLEGLQRGDRYDLSVERPGFVTATVPGVLAPAREPIRIEMKAARSLAGRVVGSNGEPVAGASLSRVEELRFGGSMSASSSSLGKTAANGRFRVTGLPAGFIDIAVSAEGYETRRLQGLQIPEDRDLEGLEIALQQGAVLEVQVLDARGEPVPDVIVHAEPEKPPDLASIRFWEPRSTATDDRGRCRVNVTVREAYRVTAMKDLQSATARLVPDAGRTPVELRLPAGFEISGRVLGEAGQSVSVYLEGAGQRGTAMPVSADGTFVFSDVPDGEYRLKAQNRQGKVSAPLAVRVAGAPVRDLELRLDREDERATLQGRILGLSPEKLRRVSVMASPTRGGGQATLGKVGPEGEYHIDGLDPGSWWVQARTAESRMATGTVQIEPGARATLDLEFPSGGLTLSGRVLLDGSPLVGAAVAIGKRNGASVASMGGVVPTAWDGGFTVGDLEPGSTTVVIFNMAGIGASRTLDLTESQEITIELATGRLRGTVLAEAGGPAEDAAVSIEALLDQEASFPAAALHSGPDGAFEAPRLISGSYRIKVEKDGFAPAELMVEIAAGEERTVEVRLTPQAP